MIESLPVLFISVHTACDCRCLMCGAWTARGVHQEISEASLARCLPSISSLGVRHVILAGGEPLKHSSLWSLCRMLKQAPVKITLVTSGMMLEAQAEEVVRHCDQVIVPLDGSPAIHDRIRQVSGCSAKLRVGVEAVLKLAPQFHVAARTVIQKHNCGDLHNIVPYASDLGVRAISFVAADVANSAFNQPEGWDEPRIAQVALSHSDLCKLSRSIEALLSDFASEFARRFILTTPRQLWDVYRYYKALLAQSEFPAVRCRLPWTSAVLEVDGQLRPCLFHPAYVGEDSQGLDAVLNSRAAMRFRRDLKVSRNDICRRCVWATSRAAFDLLV